MDKLIEKQVKFHLDKVARLSKEFTTRKNAGRKKIQKMEEELAADLARLQNQIDSHRDKAKEISRDGLQSLPREAQRPKFDTCDPKDISS